MDRACSYAEHTLLEIKRLVPGELTEVLGPIQKERNRLLKGLNTRGAVSDSDFTRLSWMTDFYNAIKGKENEETKKAKSFEWSAGGATFDAFRIKWEGQTIEGDRANFLADLKQVVVRVRGKTTPRYLIKKKHGMAMMGRRSPDDFFIRTYGSKESITEFLNRYTWEFESFEMLVCGTEKDTGLDTFNVYIPRLVRI